MQIKGTKAAPRARSRREDRGGFLLERLKLDGNRDSLYHAGWTRYLAQGSAIANIAKEKPRRAGLIRKSRDDGAVWDNVAWSLIDRVIAIDPAVWVVQRD